MNKTDKPAIYVADLGDYSAGYLTGGWIELHEKITVEEVQEKINAILKEGICQDSSHEEWAIHDYNDLPLSDEYPDLETVIAVAEAVREYGYDVVRVFLSRFYNIQKLQEKYHGVYDSTIDFIEELYSEDIKKLPAVFRSYLDYQKLERDLLNDFIIEDIENHKVVVFWY